jgi:DNA polymerase
MSDPTRFDLNDRQRAMLAEMGVRVWWPQRSNGAAPEALAEAAAQASPAQEVSASALTVAHVPSAVAPQVAPPVRTMPPVRPATPQAAPAASALAPLPQGLSGMAWPELQAAVQHCASCALCTARQSPILGTAHAPAHWMVVGDLPSEEDDAQGTPFNGPEGQLLDNMLQAVGARRQIPNEAAAPNPTQALAYLTHAVKCRPPRGRNPDAAELSVCAAYLSRQVELVQPKVILAMGRFAIQSLLGSTEPLGQLRGRLHTFHGVPVVTTYHPASLLRQPADKAKAWADLVLALQVVQG